MLSSINKAWLKEFQQLNGRAPRVLMIGNIANNAYNNAKILNQAGFDCDVICYDYYHIMGCPEWEDADLDQSPKDDFRPDWTQISLGNFTRPTWFAQGQTNDCIDYLISRRNSLPDQHIRWRKLQLYSFTTRARGLREKCILAWFRTKVFLMPYYIKVRALLAHKPQRSWVELRKGKGILKAGITKILSAVRVKRRLVNTHDDLDALFDRQEALLIRRFKAEFPKRSDALTNADVAPYSSDYKQWKKLLDLYDIVIGFSTDPFRPLLCNKPYFAMEHGTLREIPFICDAQGRRTALAYRLALHCFITNFDCASNAEILAPNRYTLINHPYDEDHGLDIGGAEQKRIELMKQLDAEFLFFHPTRQDWVEGTGFADKSNDIFLHAFAKLRHAGLRVGLIACSWGANVRESQKLLAELGCKEHSLWLPPLAITPFERICKACDLVVDQFKIGAFGGVVFKAMAVGTPIITFINHELLAQQYTETPPVINCRTTDEILSAVRPFLSDPRQLRNLGEKSRAWIKLHHGKYETINKQVDQFRLKISTYPRRLQQL